MTTVTKSPEEKNEEFKKYFDEKRKKHQNKAESQIRKGHYNGEKYHNTQKTTETLNRDAPSQAARKVPEDPQERPQRDPREALCWDPCGCQNVWFSTGNTTNLRYKQTQ